MSIYLFTNNAQTTLAVNLSAGASTCTVASGTGSLFPSPSAGQVFTITFNDAATGTISEIAYCTSRSGDVLTIVRGQEGTTAKNWIAGDLASNYFTAGAANAFTQGSNVPITVTNVTTAFYTQTVGDVTLIIATGFDVQINLLNAATYYGKTLTIKNTTGRTITSGASNVVPSGTTIAGTAILDPIVGTSCTLQSDGANWIVISSSVQPSGF